LRKAEKKVGDLRKAGKASVADAQEALVKCAKAAMKWQIASIPKCSTPELQASGVILTDEKYELPKGARLMFTGKVAAEYARAANWDAWSLVVSLRYEETITPKKFLSNPSYGHLLPSRKAVAEHEPFWASWRHSIINDKVVDLMKSESRTHQEELLKVLCMVLKEVSSIQKDLPEYALKAIDSTMRLCRGLVALLSPVPGTCNSGPDDVEHICPLDGKGGEESITLEFGLAGQAVVRALRGGVFWRGVLTKYRQYSGGELEFAKPLQEGACSSSLRHSFELVLYESLILDSNSAVAFHFPVATLDSCGMGEGAALFGFLGICFLNVELCLRNHYWNSKQHFS
jgi:hypothetical protein